MPVLKLSVLLIIIVVHIPQNQLCSSSAFLESISNCLPLLDGCLARWIIVSLNLLRPLLLCSSSFVSLIIYANNAHLVYIVLLASIHFLSIRIDLHNLITTTITMIVQLGRVSRTHPPGKHTCVYTHNERMQQFAKSIWYGWQLDEQSLNDDEEMYWDTQKDNDNTIRSGRITKRRKDQEQRLLFY